MTIHVFCDSACDLGEGPVWSTLHNALFWFDITAKSLHYKSWTGHQKHWSLDEMCSAMGVIDRNHLLVAGESGVHTFNLRKGVLKRLAKTKNCDNRLRSNDGACDAAGRFWFGTMERSAEHSEGVVYCFYPQEGLRTVIQGIGIPNTFAWSPDNCRMYLGDSMKNQISAFDYDLAKGAISDKINLIDTSGNQEVPDGSAIDVEGCIWNAQWDGAKIVRYNPDGSINQEHHLPVLRPTSCTFGGPNASVLFITSAREGMSGKQLLDYPLSGSVLYIKTEVVGIVNHQAVNYRHLT